MRGPRRRPAGHRVTGCSDRAGHRAAGDHAAAAAEAAQPHVQRREPDTAAARGGGRADRGHRVRRDRPVDHRRLAHAGRSRLQAGHRRPGRHPRRHRVAIRLRDTHQARWQPPRSG